ncbi:hypothetical protein EGL69_13615 [Vibrio parahaemolyticus]|uniref:hypothetical protein n=1 Tax=Vibrio parahaemolyticus TaxID=670 RepID=UPI00100E9E76|nr:hypothetical protein [Vibrio parahaemolyticus]RXQ03305.1 hypothetical protein EGL69_13615 [Vibrio parahaemolyticus]
MTQQNGENDMLLIDFSTLEKTTLFTGRKNGKRAKERFGVRNARQFKFIANQGQVITSSYFLGLVGEELKDLLHSLRDINELLEHLDTDSLNDISKNECIRAVRRGLVSSNDLG